jgi:RimJ/RimL family protein N-acetyltransferase
MTFELTSNFAHVCSIAKHPKIWPHLADDFTDKETWQPTEHPAFHYLLVKDGDEVLGFFLLVAHSPILFEIHTALLPECWGARAREAAHGIVDWLWSNSQTQRLFTQVPAPNRLALKFAKRAGMQIYGCNEKAYLKNGRLEDLILLGISRNGL